MSEKIYKMKQCISCNYQIEEEGECPHCDVMVTENLITSKKKRNRVFLIVLCVFTIIGSLFGILRGIFYQDVITSNGYDRGWTYIAANLGTMIGAILMIYNKKVSGLYVYSICQILYLYTVWVASNSYTDVKYLGDLSELASFISMVFLIPSILFLILYWLPINRKHLI